jgi:predicted transposase/invertase (TIGR01784 family)
VTDRQNAIGEAYMTFQPSDPDPYQIMTDAARIFFIELPKFNPKKANAKDLLTAWLSFLKDPIFMDESFLKIEEVHEAMETLKYISADDETRAIANLRQKTINDHNSEITIAREEGREEGIAIGEERGELKKARETACNLLSMGLSLEQISGATGLSVEQIKLLEENGK